MPFFQNLDQQYQFVMEHYYHTKMVMVVVEVVEGWATKQAVEYFVGLFVKKVAQIYFVLQEHQLGFLVASILCKQIR